MLYRRLRDTYRKLWVIPKLHRTYGKLTAADAFSRIYESSPWSPTDGASYDSSASYFGVAAESFVRQAIEFMKCRGIESIADLGCGDFQVGQRITSRCDVKYVGVDIVQAMVARNQISFGNDRISFLCADLAVDPLPDADLCLIRQVLQHLSNAEIHAVLENISHYKYALISEHVPKSPKSFNRDKPHGPDVRAYFGSGIYLERKPFSRDITVAWEDELDQDSLLRTVLMQRRHRGQGER